MGNIKTIGAVLLSALSVLLLVKFFLTDQVETEKDSVRKTEKLIGKQTSPQTETSESFTELTETDKELFSDAKVGSIQEDALAAKSESEVNSENSGNDSQTSGPITLNGIQLSDENSINDAFLDDQASVSRNALSEVFTSEDFHQLLSQFRVVNESQNSINREIKLINSLNDMNVSVYDEDYTCRGKICALTFTHDSLSELDVDKLGEFDSNYVFKNTVITDTGDKKVKVLYIQTEDPSTLTLSNG